MKPPTIPVVGLFCFIRFFQKGDQAKRGICRKIQKGGYVSLWKKRKMQNRPRKDS